MFCFYPTGQSFLEDNAEILARNPLETAFFEGNAQSMPNMQEGFAVKVWNDGGCLVALRVQALPMLLFGDESLGGELAACLWEHGQTFNRLLAAQPAAEAFLAAYEALAGGRHQVNHAMTLMSCRVLHDTPTAEVTSPTEADVEELAGLVLRFRAEATGRIGDLAADITDVRAALGSYAIVRRQGRIAALARRCREAPQLCAVARVFTLPELRGHGLARQVVTALTREILQDGKLPYLYVDQKNPISNHLYQSIGYTYETPQYEIAYFSASPAGRSA